MLFCFKIRWEIKLFVFVFVFCIWTVGIIWSCQQLEIHCSAWNYWVTWATEGKSSGSISCIYRLWYGIMLKSKQKSSAWDTWLVYAIITGIFVELSSSPGEITQEQMNEIQQYVVLLYVRGSELSKVNKAWKVGFIQSSKHIECSPPTLAALIEHAQRAVYESVHVYGHYLVQWENLQCPGKWDWQKVVDHVQSSQEQCLKSKNL